MYVCDSCRRELDETTDEPVTIIIRVGNSGLESTLCSSRCGEDFLATYRKRLAASNIDAWKAIAADKRKTDDAARRVRLGGRSNQRGPRSD